MQLLEVSCAVGLLYTSLGAKGLRPINEPPVLINKALRGFEDEINWFCKPELEMQLLGSPAQRLVSKHITLFCLLLKLFFLK